MNVSAASDVSETPEGVISCLLSHAVHCCHPCAQVLEKISWFVALAPSCSDQITLLNTTAADKRLVELPMYRDLLSSFLTKEVCSSGTAPSQIMGPPFLEYKVEDSLQ